ncbi:hypothetical protein QL285_074210 [Trifolium repens]|nr:hypothetical protein QL285_074210 [Trifolium repens]
MKTGIDVAFDQSNLWWLPKYVAAGFVLHLPSIFEKLAHQFELHSSTHCFITSHSYCSIASKSSQQTFQLPPFLRCDKYHESAT